MQARSCQETTPESCRGRFRAVILHTQGFCITNLEKRRHRVTTPAALTIQGMEPASPPGHTEPGAPLVISSTFTAEPIQQPLDFWIRELGLSYRTAFAPFNQVFQSLLDPSSEFAANGEGVNVVLFRWEDLGELSRIEAAAGELADAVESAARTLRARLLISVCPASPDFLAMPGNRALAARLEDDLAVRLSDLSTVQFLGTTRLKRWYDIEDYHDASGERLGHIPYTPVFFAALATLLARRLDAMRRSPYKVIVLDCDNTLWRGVVGEDGPSGVEVSPAFRALQEFVVAQHGSGMLLTICSKNNEADVEELFRLRTDMPLGRDHIVTWRVNWEPKSANIRSLASELDLGLDSFIFIDDNRKECAEVEEQCPEVLTLLLPESEDEIQPFLEHVWAFDHWSTTADDRNRSAVYAQKLERGKVEKQATNIADFIAGLELRIDVQQMRPEQLPRVSQLTQRTNQFNLTTVRRSEADIQRLLLDGYECITVDVSDRFGDYGLVGAALYRFSDDALVVDSFMLSCRALGRGVEHFIVRYFGEQALARGVGSVALPFIPTARNAPARTFLEVLGPARREERAEGAVIWLSASDAAMVSYRPDAAVVVTADEKKPTVARVSRRPSAFARIAMELRDPSEVLRRSQQPTRTSRAVTADDVPQTGLERQLASMWAEMLGLEQVGVHDDFFDLGGTSLLAVQLLSRIIDTFANENLTLSSVLAAPTVQQFGRLLEAGGAMEYRSLVPMRTGGSRPPFYFVHGGGGNVLSLRDLAMAMPSDLPFYCLQARGLDGESEPFGTVEETAAHYVSEVREFQPDGPYYFGGGCYGGLIAFEMARQLRTQGHSVGLVALVDTYNHAFGGMLPRSKLVYYNVRFVAQRVAHHLKRAARMSSAERWTYLAGRVRGLRSHVQGFLSVTTGRSSTQVVGAPPPGLSSEESAHGNFHRTLLRVVEANLEAQRRFVPGFLDGDIALFRASDRFVEPYQDRYLGWGPMVRGTITDFEVPGNHSEITEEPHVRVLAQKLDECLLKSQAG
jgi:FkbH-like protein